MPGITHIHRHQQRSGLSDFEDFNDMGDLGPDHLKVVVEANIGLHVAEQHVQDMVDGCTGDNLSLGGEWMIIERRWAGFELSYLCLCDQRIPHSPSGHVDWKSSGGRGHRATVKVDAEAVARHLPWVGPAGATDAELRFVYSELRSEFLEAVERWNKQNKPGTPWGEVFCIDAPSLPEREPSL
ncbi:hypothetical protein KG112_15615 [Nocardioides sp. zg-ZUI104]|uniref:hypothetical protein n=1 Tax=Nocardioides faecalis TaxID=2803858 RepID=UPI001BCA87CD|nr:hypothetical protein [Nocardioides faecalis]MBS4754236.1 hypothetical protein [Nocardioides faecalis]